MKSFLFFGFLLALVFSCSQKSRVNVSDNQLQTDIEHPDSALRAALVPDLDHFSISIPKNGQKYKEARQMTQGSLPVIDLAGNPQNTRSLTLSQIAGNISYLKIKLPKCKGETSTSVQYYMSYDDLTEFQPMGIVKTSNHIIVNSLYGIFLFSKEGVFLDTLYKNKLVILDNAKGHHLAFTPDKTVLSEPIVDEVSGKVYLNERDWGTIQNRLLEFHAPFLKNSIWNKAKTEKPASPLTLTNVLKINRSSQQIAILSPGILISHFPIYEAVKKQSTIMAILSNNGDTICDFQSNLPFKPFVSGIYRCPEERKSYRFNHQYTFKQEYNDTIFRVIPPNQLSPCFVFNFGNKKLSSEVAYNPKINVDDKIHMDDFFETQNFILIKLAFGDRTRYFRKDGKAHFCGTYYDKRSGQVYYLPGEGTSPDDFNIPNDIDGGMPFWPKEMTDNGEMISWIDGKTMKQTLTKEWFAKSSAPQNRKAALQEYLKTVEDDDAVIITVK